LIIFSTILFGLATFLGILGVIEQLKKKQGFLEERMEGKVLTNQTNYKSLFDEDEELTYKEKVEVKIEKSGLEIRFQEYIYMMIGFVFFFFTAGLIIFHGRMIPAIFISLIGFFVPNWYLKRRYNKRLKEFNNQLVDTLRTLSSSLRGGLSLEQSLMALAESAPSPTKEEFQKVKDDLNYGKGLDESLNALQNRIDDSDMDLIMTVIFIQKDIGGNLTESLDTIADTIEERIKLKNQLKALTSNGRLSAFIIGGVPIILFLLLNLIDRSYFNNFFESPLGMIMLGVAFFLDIIGVIFSIKLATPEITEI